jgi:triosephosphate isomerase
MKIIVGNWKMNGTADLLTKMMDSIAELNTNNRVILCVPYTMLRSGTSSVMIGAQNISKYESGAHTGEISANFVSMAGANATLVGHSECRESLHDTNTDVAIRAENAIKNDLIPIICVGETATERDMGLTTQIIESGVRESVPKCATDGGFIIAYEPRWAIGAGITPTNEQIVNAHKIIRETLTNMGYVDVPILYGASVTGQNSGEIMSLDNVDGVLVGGASLKLDDFIPIIKSAK